MEFGKPEFLTIAETAHHFKVSKGTIRRWTQNGLLPGICILHSGKRQKIRIRQETIDIFFAKAKQSEERQRAYEQEAEREWQERQNYCFVEPDDEIDEFDVIWKQHSYNEKVTPNS